MTIIKILALVFVGLVAGGWMMGSMLVVPAQKRLNAQQYTAVEQANTSFGARYFPVLVITSIILLSVLTYLLRADKSQMIVVGASLALMVVALGFTGSRIVPINKKIDTWSVQTPPSDWQTVRDSWHTNHRIRTGIAFVAFLLLSVAIVQDSPKSTSTARASASKTAAVAFRQTN